VTVVARASIVADGWDTTLLTMGAARGLAIAKSLGLDAVLVGSDHKLYATDDMKKMLTITDPSFTYAVP
jgi:thiamine biosynthesis lipoprotein ApbE